MVRVMLHGQYIMLLNARLRPYDLMTCDFESSNTPLITDTNMNLVSMGNTRRTDM